jgi:hypothetical protein
MRAERTKPGRASSRLDIVREMIAPVVRTRAYVPAAASIGVLIGAVVFAEAGDPRVPNFIELMRNGAMILGMGAGFALDDEAAETLSAVPFSLIRRRLVRALMTLATIVPWWIALVGYARLRGGRVPVGDLSIELAAYVGLGFALASGFIKLGRSRPGDVVAVSLLLFRGVTQAIPPRWGLWGGLPGSEVWSQGHRRGAAVALAALLLAAMMSHDPAKRTFMSRFRDA